MANPKQERDAARRQRQKKHRAAAARSRATQEHISLSAAQRWPWREAWVSDNWPDPGAEIRAIARRAHDDGRSGWIVLHVHLADGTIDTLSAETGTADQAQRALLDLSAHSTMLETDPASVAYLLSEALRHAPSTPSSAKQARALLSDLDPDETAISVQFLEDAPTDPGVAEPPHPGFFARLWRRARS